MAKEKKTETETEDTETVVSKTKDKPDYYLLRVIAGFHMISPGDVHPDTDFSDIIDNVVHTPEIAGVGVKVQKMLKEGDIFKSNRPLHEIHQNKFELLSSEVDDDDDPEIDNWVDKTKAYPIAAKKGFKVFRERESKEYQIRDSSGKVVKEFESKEEVNTFLEGLIAGGKKKVSKKKE